MAWSFGVPAANAFLRSRPELPVTARIAVNGTLHPVDDLRGIPEAIFKGTLDGLSPAVLTKFRRRMCGSSEAFVKFSLKVPERTDIAELADELRAIRRLPDPDGDDRLRWDTVVVADSDRIIPTDNQYRAWEGHPCIITISGSHLPDFDSILSRMLKDKSLIAERFGRSCRSYDTSATAQKAIADRLNGMIDLALGGMMPDDILEIGCGTGLLTRLIADRLRPSTLILWDIAPISGELPGLHRQCDAEAEIRRQSPDSLDMIISASTIQWFNSPAAFIRCCRPLLRPGGILAFSTFGPDNLAELQPYLKSSLNYADLPAWSTILQSSDFEVVTSLEEHITLTFTDTASLLRHLRLTGVNALPSGMAPTSTTRAILSSGLTSLTYHPLYFIARV